MSEICAGPFCPRKGGSEAKARLKPRWCSSTAGNADPSIIEMETKSHVCPVRKSEVWQTTGSTGCVSLLLILLSGALLQGTLELHAWHSLWTCSQSDECPLNWLFILKYIIIGPSREMESSTTWMTTPGRRRACKPPPPPVACTNLKDRKKSN